ncbi:MAG: energy-coupling factor transporter ATPase [Ruminococcus sp.]|nr:energy-coupling factor transporter ATPase [Ruminococcus sp.]MDO4419784.1 energy-coupling factor transporter ATPase [Ruminococcus sp.]
MSILRTENLSLVYGKGTPFEKRAVNNVNIDINEGEVIGIIGHTGSGKSSLVQMLNGLFKPTEGTVYFEGQDIFANSKELRKFRFNIGLVFQYPENQLFEETVAKDIAFGPKNMGLSDEEIKEKVRKAARFAGLKDELLDRSPFDLSGGEKRRAAIAGVIAMEPKVLILDEPTAGLDPVGKDVLLTQIEAYHKESGNTVLLVSHNMEDIARISDRVLVMNNSEAVMFDTPEAVFSRVQELKSIGLRIPEITEITIKLKEAGVPLSSGILTVEQAFKELCKIISKGGKADA